MTDKRCCGTCRHWDSTLTMDGSSLCMWVIPPLPFWAMGLSHGGDHSDWTTADQGRRCQTWVKRQPDA
jgi:hypothetical protein